VTDDRLTDTEANNGRLSNSEPSFTALTAAAARAAHLVVDQSPFLFADTLATRLLGERADELIGYHRQHRQHPILSAARGQVICRSRYAEDHLAAAAAAGVRQYVLLGAGLDTFACRSPLAGQISVFEVDHAATQNWKRAALAAAGIHVPPSVAFIAAGLGTGALAEALADGGFDFGQPAVISWLGVIMYLDHASVGQALSALANCAPGTELIADYMLPAGLRDNAGDQYVELIGPAAAQRGEPWQSFFAPDEMTALLAEHGFEVASNIGQGDTVPTRMWQRADSLRPIELSMIVRATLSG
jgi:methyltransferase (TIGR00027 family)